MRVIYADAGLRDNTGANANLCRLVSNELRRRDISSRVLAYAQLEPSLRVELGAIPFFRWFLYDKHDSDPICGWLTDFQKAAAATREDLERITDIQSGDIFYFAAAYPAQLMGTILWMADLPPERVPFALVELLGDPGVDVEEASDGKLIVRDPRLDSRATLYRYAAQRISALGVNRLRIAYADAVGAAVFSAVMGREVCSIPLAIESITSARSRAGAKPIVVSLLGVQSNREKGFHLVCEIATGLLASNPDVRIVAHDSSPWTNPELREQVRTLAAKEPRVTFDERPVDLTRWAELLDATDLMLCPYDPDAYCFRTSAIVAEGIANAIPLVVPAGTSPARYVEEFGCGITFERFSAASVLAATRNALNHFDELADAARLGAERWRETRGPRALVDAMFAFSQTERGVPSTHE